MTNLISAEGLKKLCEEYDYLWKVERPKVVRGVSDAAAEGDRSENAEYIYGKKR
ncbi:MAG: transcription elongation factor GreB, partial [Desulfuromonadales bacterium]